MKKLALALLALYAAAAAADTNRIVMRVNENIATLYDYQARYSERLQALQRANMPEAARAERLASLGESVFREMFDELLMLSRASQLGLRVTDEMVDAAVQQLREANNLTDDAAFDAALAQSAMTRDELRDQARRNLLLQHVTSRELQDRVELDEEDLRRYYQGHLETFSVPRRLQLESIVVLETGGLDADARAQLAAEAADVLRAGVDVEGWTTSHSQGGQTTGLIDLGWIKQGDLAAELESAVWSLGAGDVSAATSSRGGLHVVHVKEVEEAHVRPFSEVKGEVQRLEMSRLQDEAVTRMLADFESSSFVRIDPPPEAAGFRASRTPVEEPFGEIGTEPDEGAEGPEVGAEDAPDPPADGPR
jgi:parvulin-like peptidyl-prolyl isomerase